MERGQLFTTMIGPIRYFGPPSVFLNREFDPIGAVDSFIAGAAPFAYAYAPVYYLPLYWRLTDAAMNAEFWTSLYSSLRESRHRMLMTATRPPALA